MGKGKGKGDDKKASNEESSSKGGKGKGPKDEKKLKAANSINVRHILVRRPAGLTIASCSV